jgi:hypothetical protein
VQILAEARDMKIRVCESCLEAANIDERLEENGKKYEAAAARARSLIGRLEVPTFDQWKAEMAAADKRWEEDGIPF